jgi:2-polyprenyl-6-methoxyphenol hydroxylase-like FAD-dependent oxidoreductase
MLDVGVVGGGTAGCAVAAFLARAGHSVTVYERVPKPGPVGAGITLQPSGLSVLRALGVAEEVVTRGAPFKELLCETTSGRALVKLDYHDAGPGLFGLGVHRGVIFEAVQRAAREAGARFVLGVTCENLSRHGKSRDRGPLRRSPLTITDPEGQALGTHELVIVADGSRSHLRDDTVIPKHVALYPWGALWFVGQDPTGELSAKLHQVVEGNQQMIGLLPTGKGPLSVGADVPQVSLFASIRATNEPAVRARGLAAFKAHCQKIHPRTEAVLDQIRSMDQILFTQYHDVSMYPWNTGNVVYIGDAAHAMSPQLGQGCNLALMDARILADSIASCTYLPEALDSYSRTRRAHLQFYSWATRLLTPFFQGDEQWFGILRDLGMPIMMRVPWMRRMMTLSMCGTLTSVFGQELELP